MHIYFAIKDIHVKDIHDNSAFFAPLRDKTLFRANSLSKAKYIEQEIEKHLGIEDRKVPEGIG